MILTLTKEGSVRHKLGCGIIPRVAPKGLLGINWPLSLVAPSISVAFLGIPRFVHVITLEVLCSKCVTGKLRRPKNNLACVFPIVSHWVCCVRWAALDPGVILFPADRNEVAELLVLKCCECCCRRFLPMMNWHLQGLN